LDARKRHVVGGHTLAYYYIATRAREGEAMLEETILQRSIHIPRRPKTILQACADALAAAGRPLHSHEIVQGILSAGDNLLTGSTPWKTVTAKISVDIRINATKSQFQRVGPARFALREWHESTEFLVNRRRTNPIDETIRVVPRESFDRLIKRCRPQPLFRMNVENLINASIPMTRVRAEETADFVQLIPTFVIRKADTVLTYRRTKRLPEARLHNSRCVSFGGHMQVDDLPDLFAQSYYDPNTRLYRELYEELSFSEPVVPRYLGVLYLTSSMFERQHAGIVFNVKLGRSVHVESLETTRHVDVKFDNVCELDKSSDDLDSWSRVLLKVMNV